MPANPHRGEIEIALVTPDGDERKFVMRPSFQALAEIESMAGVGIVPLARRFMARQWSITDATAVITAGLKAAGEPAKYEKVGEMVFRTGLSNIAKPINDFLEASLSGGEKPRARKSGEAEAPDRT